MAYYRKRSFRRRGYAKRRFHRKRYSKPRGGYRRRHYSRGGIFRKISTGRLAPSSKSVTRVMESMQNKFTYFCTRLNDAITNRLIANAKRKKLLSDLNISSANVM